MAGVKVSYEVISNTAVPGLAGLDLRCRNLTPVLEDFCGHMVGSVQKNFDVEGRPAHWAPLKLATLNGWLNSRKSWQTKGGNISKKGREALAGRKILTDTARLRNSIHFRVVPGGGGVEGYTNVLYAAIQQLGGQTRPHDIRPRNKKALFWPGAAHPVKLVHHPGSHLPARPYLLFQAEDISYLFQHLRVYVGGQ